jgi:hypothetical protein
MWGEVAQAKKKVGQGPTFFNVTCQWQRSRAAYLDEAFLPVATGAATASLAA